MTVKQKTPETNPKKLKFHQFRKKVNVPSSTRLQANQALALFKRFIAKNKKDLTLSHSIKTKKLIKKRAIKNRWINQYNKPI